MDISLTGSPPITTHTSVLKGREEPGKFRVKWYYYIISQEQSELDFCHQNTKVKLDIILLVDLNVAFSQKGITLFEITCFRVS